MGGSCSPAGAELSQGVTLGVPEGCGYRKHALSPQNPSTPSMGAPVSPPSPSSLAWAAPSAFPVPHSDAEDLNVLVLWKAWVPPPCGGAGGD